MQAVVSDTRWPPPAAVSQYQAANHQAQIQPRYDIPYAGYPAAPQQLQVPPRDDPVYSNSQHCVSWDQAANHQVPLRDDSAYGNSQNFVSWDQAGNHQMQTREHAFFGRHQSNGGWENSYVASQAGWPREERQWEAYPTLPEEMENLRGQRQVANEDNFRRGEVDRHSGKKGKNPVEGTVSGKGGKAGKGGKKGGKSGAGGGRRAVDDFQESAHSISPANDEPFKTAIMEAQCHLKMLMPNHIAGAIIGKEGVQIGEILLITQCEMQISACDVFFPGTYDRILVMGGSMSSIEECIKCVLRRLREVTNCGNKSERSLLCKLAVPSSAVSGLIGHQGDKVKRLSDQTQCRINMSPRVEGMQERLVLICGDYDRLVNAVILVAREIQGDSHMREHLALKYDNVHVPLGAWSGGKANPVDPLAPLIPPQDAPYYSKRELIQYLQQAAPREILLRHCLLGKIENTLKSKGQGDLRSALQETWDARVGDTVGENVKIRERPAHPVNGEPENGMTAFSGLQLQMMAGCLPPGEVKRPQACAIPVGLVVNSDAPRAASPFLGNWLHSDGFMVEITEVGNKLRINHPNDGVSDVPADSFLSGGHFPDEGTVSVDGNSISWSNGATWIRKASTAEAQHSTTIGATVATEDKQAAVGAPNFVGNVVPASAPSWDESYQSLGDKQESLEGCAGKEPDCKPAQSLLDQSKQDGNQDGNQGSEKSQGPVVRTDEDAICPLPGRESRIPAELAIHEATCQRPWAATVEELMDPPVGMQNIMEPEPEDEEEPAAYTAATTNVPLNEIDLEYLRPAVALVASQVDNGHDPFCRHCEEVSTDEPVGMAEMAVQLLESGAQCFNSLTAMVHSTLDAIGVEVQRRQQALQNVGDAQPRIFPGAHANQYLGVPPIRGEPADDTATALVRRERQSLSALAEWPNRGQNGRGSSTTTPRQLIPNPLGDASPYERFPPGSVDFRESQDHSEVVQTEGQGSFSSADRAAPNLADHPLKAMGRILFGAAPEASEHVADDQRVKNMFRNCRECCKLPFFPEIKLKVPDIHLQEASDSEDDSMHV